MGLWLPAEFCCLRAQCENCVHQLRSLILSLGGSWSTDDQIVRELIRVPEGEFDLGTGFYREGLNVILHLGPDC